MKGKNLVKTPGELYAPTAGGVVASADGIKDYRQGKFQETINQELVDMSEETRKIADKAASSSASIANIVSVLEEHSEENLADVLQLEDRMEDAESSIEDLQTQLGKYAIVESSETAYETLVNNDQTDNNTLYLIPEEDE